MCLPSSILAAFSIPQSYRRPFGVCHDIYVWLRHASCPRCREQWHGSCLEFAIHEEAARTISCRSRRIQQVALHQNFAWYRSRWCAILAGRGAARRLRDAAAHAQRGGFAGVGVARMRARHDSLPSRWGKDVRARACPDKLGRLVATGKVRSGSCLQCGNAPSCLRFALHAETPLSTSSPSLPANRRSANACTARVGLRETCSRDASNRAGGPGYAHKPALLRSLSQPVVRVDEQVRGGIDLILTASFPFSNSAGGHRRPTSRRTACGPCYSPVASHRAVADCMVASRSKQSPQLDSRLSKAIQTASRNAFSLSTRERRVDDRSCCPVAVNGVREGVACRRRSLHQLSPHLKSPAACSSPDQKVQPPSETLRSTDCATSSPPTSLIPPFVPD